MARKRRRRRSQRSKRTAQNQVSLDANVPTQDFFEHINLDDPGDLDKALNNLVFDLKAGYFLQWEAVVRQEQGLRLTKAQNKALSSLISFSDEEDDRILYIDEIARPSERWYEIARKIVPRLLQEPFKTFEIRYAAVTEGWLKLAECLEEYAQDLPLPEGVTSPLNIFSVELCHRLWLQTCFAALSGLGQDEELTLENEGQQDRVEWFIDLLKEHKDTVQYFDLTLETLLTRVILPPKDEKVFAEMMMEQLSLISPQDHLADFL
jgi:hypothetical protein